MNIYKLNNEAIKKYIIKFNKTSYGLTTFVLSYSISLILFLSLVLLTILFITKLKYCFIWFYPILLGYIFLILVTFILGSIHYYNELKQYIKTINN